MGGKYLKTAFRPPIRLAQLPLRAWAKIGKTIIIIWSSIGKYWFAVSRWQTSISHCRRTGHYFIISQISRAVVGGEGGMGDCLRKLTTRNRIPAIATHVFNRRRSDGNVIIIYHYYYSSNRFR